MAETETKKGPILLCAGGTGGHLFPAEALAYALKARGHAVHLVTDSRAERFAGSFPAEEMHIVPSATLGSKNPLKIAGALWRLFKGVRAAGRLARRVRPSAVVGFGGYPTVPPLIAATNAGIPTVIHEANGVMGRANKALANRVDAIAGGFLPEGKGRHADKTITTGNPVRPAVLEASGVAYDRPSADAPFRFVVFGGSQGAQFFSQAVPAAIRALPDDLRNRLVLTQQARKEDLSSVEAAYTEMGIAAEVAPFFTDMAARIGSAHLVMSRSGASTVTELSVIGRPAILVPYPHALDHDQAANAAALQAKGGAMLIAQKDLSVERLTELLAELMADPEKLVQMAANAKAAGNPDATGLLASLVEAIAERTPVAQFKAGAQ